MQQSNPIKKDARRHVMIVACPSLAFAFMLLLTSHAIITGFACIYCILFLYFLALSSLHPLTYVFHNCLTCFSLPNTCSSISAREPHPLCSSRSRETHNNEDMAFVYRSTRNVHVFLALLVQERSYEDSVGQRHSAG